MQKPNKPCWTCGANDWWQRPDGGWSCGRCHPNPNPGSAPEMVVVSDQPLYLPSRRHFKHCIPVLGNKKLNDAWAQIEAMAHDTEEWSEQVEHWHQANEKLSVLCTQLEALGYRDCLYLDGQGRKTVKCLEQGGIGCRVCPSKIAYWEQELMELPSPGAEAIREKPAK